MEWKDLLSSKRARMIGQRSGNATGSDLRSEFEKDYHRIIGSSAFRRLQDKTQVFPLDRSDFVRTRLTHSLEVSSFAKSLGQNIAQYLLQNHLDDQFTEQTRNDICDILQCAGLIHDIGNPPFGHFGEEAIRGWFCEHLSSQSLYGKPVTELLTEQMKQDLFHFEGNAQALRLVSKLHYLVDEHGMNLTYALLNTIIKYPVSSIRMNPQSDDVKEKKMGYFYAEESLYQDIVTSTTAADCRHPLAFILEAADDIAYTTADIEDSFKKGYISYDHLLQELEQAQAKAVGDKPVDAVGMLRHQYDNALKRGAKDPQLYAVQNWVVRVQSALIFSATYGFTCHYRQIMAGTYQKDLFDHTYGQWLIESLKDIALRYTFLSRKIMTLEISSNQILTTLLDILVPAAVHYDSSDSCSVMEEKAISLLSENHLQIYHIYAEGKDEAERLYLRLLLATDFVSGMTDSYAKDLYQKLSGIV